tara:strand:+ start:117 stop:470 length:354 start_codon:yes stop_codon:yes gene_type:complete
LKKNPIIIKNNIVPKLFSLFIPIAAITLWPFIFVKEEYAEDEVLINHETIHFYQYQELWVVGLYFLYMYDWIHGLIKYKDPTRAYFKIRFEQEAYMWQENMLYAECRKPFAWKRFKV